MMARPATSRSAISQSPGPCLTMVTTSRSRAVSSRTRAGLGDAGCGRGADLMRRRPATWAKLAVVLVALACPRSRLNWTELIGEVPFLLLACARRFHSLCRAPECVRVDAVGVERDDLCVASGRRPAPAPAPRLRWRAGTR